MLGVVLGVRVAHQEPAQPLAEIREASGSCDAHDRGERHQAPYLNDSARRARNCVTLPFWILTSSFSISAMRRSRSVPAAVLTAFFAASSHDCALVPIPWVTQ